MKRLAILGAALFLFGAGVGAAWAQTPPPRRAYPTKGNLPQLRRMMLRGCVISPDTHKWVCPIPAP